jgi:hypothetical protein
LDLLSAAGEHVVRQVSHFSILREVGPWKLRNQHSHLLLALMLGLVSTRVPVRSRLRRFGSILLLIMVADLVSAIVAVQLWTAKTVYEEQGLLLLLPWEFNAVECLWYLTYVIPLQAAPFVLLFLTVIWNGGKSIFTGPAGAASDKSPGSEKLVPLKLPHVRRWVACSGVIAVSAGLLAGSVWIHLRELDPLHQRTHVALGNLLYSRGNLETAKKEYQRAVAGGTRDGEAWFKLAQILQLEGDSGRSTRVLRQGRLVMRDSRWIERTERSLLELQERPMSEVPTITVIPPPETKDSE